jgi:hypothetical protein
VSDIFTDSDILVIYHCYRCRNAFPCCCSDSGITEYRRSIAEHSTGDSSDPVRLLLSAALPIRTLAAAQAPHNFLNRQLALLFLLSIPATP